MFVLLFNISLAISLFDRPGILAFYNYLVFVKASLALGVSGELGGVSGELGGVSPEPNTTRSSLLNMAMVCLRPSHSRSASRSASAV